VIDDGLGYKVSGPHVAAKLMDGELVIINLRNGLYYASTGVGVRIWRGVELGAPLSRIVGDVVAHYEVPTERATADVSAFIDKLVSESLLEPGTATSATLPDGAERGQPYESPVLTTYDDMAETFALDPPLRL
jgi:hypothetical protein